MRTILLQTIISSGKGNSVSLPCKVASALGVLKKISTPALRLGSIFPKNLAWQGLGIENRPIK